jgi:antitoxin component YwqK of YwqJK toxin-antitoxin module
MTDTKLKPIIEYYDDGKIKRAYSVDENGNKQGPYERYYENGQLRIKCTYKDGKEDGPYELYHENGQLEEKCTYKDGELDGPYESYHENGQLREKYTYKDGRVEKVFAAEYNSDGSSKTSMEYIYDENRDVIKYTAIKYKDGAISEKNIGENEYDS